MWNIILSGAQCTLLQSEESIMIYESIQKLIKYAERNGLITADDEYIVRNQLMEILQLSDWEENNADDRNASVEALLEPIISYAVEKGLIQDTAVYRDLFDTKIMGVFTPFPHEVNAEFQRRLAVSPKEATDWYFDFSKKLNYVRAERIARDMKWTYDSEYGVLDITINRSKPEKDPRDIAAAKTQKASKYPKCQLCAENMGFAGHLTHPARQNLRPVKVEMNGSEWFLQYSPYGYYNEHCIVFNKNHVPMVIDDSVFDKLFDFIEQFPHYMLGSNADLPIVGGSILTHEHFQGGRYTFPMARASVEKPFLLSNHSDVNAGIVKWPMSVIRLSSYNRASLSAACAEVLKKWRAYTDEQAGIFAQTDGVPHNTITPIARMNGSQYECDLVLRNNITSEDRPLGIFHPAPALHHIKKENIGLIEVMGLAVLPARLATELSILRDAMLSGADIAADERIASHADWAKEVLAAHPEFNADNAMDIIHAEVGKVFGQVLEDAGVFKRTESGKEAFKRFVSTL